MTDSLRLTSAFEPFTIALVREIEAAGWQGRISTRGHAIMRAPDGETTCSIPPKAGAPQDRLNIGRAYRRWQKAQQPAEAPQKPVRRTKAESVVRLRQELAQAREEVARLRTEVAVWQALAEETEEALVNALGGARTR
jgi:hypothetical protein